LGVVLGDPYMASFCMGATTVEEERRREDRLLEEESVEGFTWTRDQADEKDRESDGGTVSIEVGVMTDDVSGGSSKVFCGVWGERGRERIGFMGLVTVWCGRVGRTAEGGVLGGRVGRNEHYG
jgi:hypothetical protein